jgi:hypothetical protein
MRVGKIRLYRIILFYCILGYLWITLSFFLHTNNHYSFCVIKRLIGYACPGCGTTRSMLALFSGDISKAFYFNPLGVFFGLALILFPLWMLYDFILKKESFLICYQWFESKLKKHISIFFILVLMILNWMWNIQKDI